MDHTFAVAYGSDFEQAKQVLIQVLERNEKVLKDPAPMVRVCTQSGGTVELTCRGWVNSADYWDVFFDLQEKFYTELPKQGFQFAYPHMDVSMIEHKV